MAECHRLGACGYNIERWYRDGELHREGGPAEIHYKNGQKVDESWYCDGEIHRDDGPAEIWHRDGQLRGEHWRSHGKLHRVDGPAKIEYGDGQIVREYWYRDDKRHRDDGPAEIWYKNGQVNEECWFRDGSLCPINVLASTKYQNIDSRNWYSVGYRNTQNIDEFRDAVKGDAIHDALRPLPIPIRQAIIPHYCYQ